jgi:hypothetical protein
VGRVVLSCREMGKHSTWAFWAARPPAPRGINLFDFVAGIADHADGTKRAVVWRLNPALALGSVHAVDLGTFGGNVSEANGINNFGSSALGG